MKKTKFFFLMAAAALMTACSSDDALNKENLLSSVDLSDRIELGNVEIGTAAQSRGALTDNKLYYSETYKPGDAIGAVLIDQLKAGAYSGSLTSSSGGTELQWGADQKVNGKPISKGTDISYADYKAGFEVNDPSYYYSVINNQIWTNYEYVCKEAGKFNTEATLVEGNYLFYSPFNGDIQTRGPIDVVFPMVQDCSADAATMRTLTYQGEDVEASCKALSDLYSGSTKDYETAISSIGYQFLPKVAKGEKIKPNVTMNYLYATPMITIINNFDGVLVGNDASAGKLTAYSGEMEIEKVILYHDATAQNIFGTGKLVNTSVDDINRNWTMANTLKANTNTYTSSVVNGTVATLAVSNLDKPKLPASSTDASAVLSAMSNLKGGNYITCVINKKLAKGEAYHFEAVLPAGNYQKSLRALVYAKIGKNRYVLTDGLCVGTNSDKKQLFTAGETTTAETSLAINGYAFKDADHGDEDVQLLRGYNVPAAELKVSSDYKTVGKKAFAGQMMTIELAAASLPTDKDKKGVPTWAAFELNVEEAAGPDPDDLGIKDNKDWIDYISDWVQRGVFLTEDAGDTKTGSTISTRYTARKKWGLKFAFAKGDNNKVVLDGALINDLRNGLQKEDNKGNYLTLSTKLPIAADVTVVQKTEGVAGRYTFTSKVGEKKSYEFIMNGSAYSTSTKAADNKTLNKGITELSATETIKGAEDGAVLFLSPASGASYAAPTTYTITSADKIREIHVKGNATKDVKVIVNCTLANTIVTAENVQIVLGSDGDLANTSNSLTDCEFTNNDLKAINGKLAGTTKVTANFGAWPDVVLPEASRVNAINIAPTANTVLTINQAQVDMLKNLKNGAVTVTLSANVTGIVSSADVTLSNIAELVSLKSGGIEWNSTMNVLTVYGKGTVSGSTDNRTDINNISNDPATVTFDPTTTK